jgi:DNA-binding CsgD family transcriptional regulator
MPSSHGRIRGNASKPDAKRLVPGAPRPLTARELEVVEWIVEAKRNGEIGEILGCSPRTVQKHVQHILEKLHLETRIAVCAWWYARQLARKNRTRPRRKKVRKIA